jgi:hypothetical protein
MTSLMEYSNEFNFENKYNQLTRCIDYNYLLSPNTCNFIPIEYFSGSWQPLDDILNYCFRKKYIDKNDNKFQKFVADCICNMNSDDQFNIIIYKPGIQTIENLRVFYYVCKYILNVETIKNYVNDKNETLLDQIFIKINLLDVIIINHFLIIFDKANFNYTSEIMKSILIKNIEFNNIPLITIILQKKKIDLNEEDIFKVLIELILVKITPLKYKTKISSNPIYKITYDNNTLLKNLFSEEMLDESYDRINTNSDLNQNVIKSLQLYYGNNNYCLFENSLSRSKLVRPLKNLIKYYNFFEIFINSGLDLSKKLNGITLYDVYMDGSYPIKLLQPDIHKKFVNLLSNIR